MFNDSMLSARMTLLVANPPVHRSGTESALRSIIVAGVAPGSTSLSLNAT